MQPLRGTLDPIVRYIPALTGNVVRSGDVLIDRR
jgi:hypothetical protein